MNHFPWQRGGSFTTKASAKLTNHGKIEHNHHSQEDLSSKNEWREGIDTLVIPPELKSVINKLSDLFLIGGSAAKSFKYIGLNVVSTTCGVITVDQFQYASSSKPIPVSHQRATMKTSELSAPEKKEFQALIGQLNWNVTHTRPDIAFDVCELTLSAALDAVCVHCRDSVTALWTQTASTANIFFKYSW